jgi:hypothetical protein
MNTEKDFRKKRLEEIKQTKFLNLMDFGDLLGYNKFKKGWDFQEIINSLTDWHRHTGFFEIYHNDIHFDLISIASWELQQDFTLWKCNGVKFYHFKDWLSYILILSLNNIPKNLRKQFENGDLKDPSSEDSLFCTDKNGIVELVVYEDLKNFLDEEISNFLKNLNPPNLPNECRVPFSSRNKEAIKYLFELLQTNKFFVRSLLARQEKADNVLKYFPPSKSDYAGADIIFENEWQSIQRFLEVKKLLFRTIFENENVECFIQNQNGVYKKVLGLGKSGIQLGRNMFFSKVSNVAYEERSGEEILEDKAVQIFVSNSSAINFAESLSEDVSIFSRNAGRPTPKNTSTLLNPESLANKKWQPLNNEKDRIKNYIKNNFYTVFKDVKDHRCIIKIISTDTKNNFGCYKESDQKDICFTENQYKNIVKYCLKEMERTDLIYNFNSRKKNYPS